MTRRHWTDGLRDDAIRAELAAREHEDSARWLEEMRANLDGIAGLDRADSWERDECPEWVPGSLKRVDEYIEGGDV